MSQAQTPKPSDPEPTVCSEADSCLPIYCPRANVLAINHQIDLCGKNEETQAPLLVAFLLFCFACQKQAKPFLTYLYLHQKSHDQQSLEMFSLLTLACVLQCIPKNQMFFLLCSIFIAHKNTLHKLDSEQTSRVTG